MKEKSTVDGGDRDLPAEYAEIVAKQAKLRSRMERAQGNALKALDAEFDTLLAHADAIWRSMTLKEIARANRIVNGEDPREQIEREEEEARQSASEAETVIEEEIEDADTDDHPATPAPRLPTIRRGKPAEIVSIASRREPRAEEAREAWWVVRQGTQHITACGPFGLKEDAETLAMQAFINLNGFSCIVTKASNIETAIRAILKQE